MSSRIILLKGLPGSGKSTWRKEFIRQNPKWVYTNKDEIRRNLRLIKGIAGDGWNKSLEKDVEEIEYNVVVQYLSGGHNIIIDNTHLDPRHEEKYRKLAIAWYGDFEVKFFDVPLEECLRRNALREGEARVPEEAIRNMYNKWLRPKPISPPKIPGLDYAILVDLDGTLALFEDNPYDRDFSKDKLNVAVAEVVQAMRNKGYVVIITSGRNGKFRTVTENWFQINHVNYDKLLMRREKDNRKDNIVKEEFYHNEIEGKYNVLFVIDDRPQVVRFWRSLGLFVFDVNQTGKEF